MSGIFSSPKAPDVKQIIEEAPKPASVNESQKNLDEELRKAKRKGRASTVLASEQRGALVKTLLGQ